MKANDVHEYGGPEVLKFEEYPAPVPGRGEVRVRVAAASVNPIDYKRRAGLTKDFYPIHFPGLIETRSGCSRRRSWRSAAKTPSNGNTV